MRKFFILFTTIIQYLFLSAQSDSLNQQNCGLRISLLTCTPGQELYSTFGHSALRVVDSINNTDLVYNYGTFDFYDPKFYQKFIKGKLLYFVSVDSLPAFLWEYEYYKRGVTEQVLNLSCTEKQDMVDALNENAKEENKYYRYDFNYDNCTTRLRDILEKSTGKQLQTKNILPDENTTFRDLIHDYLDRGGQQWSKLGIDILLGSPLDKNVTNREAMFLPDYLLMAFDSSRIDHQRLVSEKRILLNEFEAYKTKNIITPFLVFLVFFILVFVFSIFKKSSWKIFFKAFDFVLFFTLGAIGILLLFMWFGTDHAMCKENYNILWALPTHFPAAFLLLTGIGWTRAYFRLVFFYSLLLLVVWYILPQEMNNALLPITGIILVRSYYRSKRN